MKKTFYFNFIFLLLVALVSLMTLDFSSNDNSESTIVNGKWEDEVSAEIDKYNGDPYLKNFYW